MASAQPTSGHRGPALASKLATSRSQFRESQHLRYRLYPEQLVATVPAAMQRYEADTLDLHCHHPLVRNRHSDQTIASIRILTDTQSRRCSGFAVEHVFGLSPALALPGRIVEIGRLCTDPECRNGTAIGVLLAALARFLLIHRVDYLIGCVSISLFDGGVGGHTAASQNAVRIDAPAPLRARPRHHLSAPLPTRPHETVLPPTVDALARLGAWICGEPSLDHTLGLAALSIVLGVNRIDARYLGRFVPSRAAAPALRLPSPASRMPTHAYRETYP